MNPDGVSYIDLARMVQEGRWAALANSYWAPLLPILLSGLELEDRFAQVQGLMALVSLSYFASGSFVLRELWWRDGWVRGHTLSFQQIRIGMFFVALLAASHTVLTGPHVLTPDGLAGCFTLLAAGLLLRAERIGYSLRTAGILGLALGMGYLAKYPLFLFGFVLLFLNLGRNWRFVAVSAGAFGLVAGPWICLLSARYGRWTFADSGWLNFAWFTGQLPRMGRGTAFVAREGATYAAWLDPGMVVSKLELSFPVARLFENVIWHLSWVTISPILAGLCVLAAWHLRGGWPKWDWRFLWPAIAIGSYLPVTLMCRYAAAWVVLVFGLWGAYALRSRAHLLIVVVLVVASVTSWRRIGPEREAAERSVEFARMYPELRGRVVQTGRDPFGASIDFVRLRARVAPISDKLSHTIEGQWQILDFSDSASWGTPWRGISLKQGTR